MIEIEFTKASGAGNDFVIIDDRANRLALDKVKLATALCDRHFGIGADGLLVLAPSRKADFSMQYFNADGSYGGMCGNGGRCLARFAHLKGVTGSSMDFDALDYVYHAEIVGQNVRLRMKKPRVLKDDIQIEAAGVTFVCSLIDTGAPHAVTVMDEIGSINVKQIGRILREHPVFQPSGANVNFVQISGTSAIDIRTYERGVEDETLACGTGAVASAAVACLRHNIGSPVKVRVRSGEILLVYIQTTAGNITEAQLEGSAHILFDGKVVYDPIQCRIFGKLDPLILQQQASQSP